jgi:hypothetical protein
VATPLEVDASGATQKSGRPAVEGDHRGERRPSWPTGEAVVRRPPRTGPYLNGVGPRVKVEGPRGVAIAAVRGDGDSVAVGATTAAAGASGRCRSLEAVAQHTKGRRSSPGRRHSRGRVGRQTLRVWK